ncbi:MAG: hypothetical protein HUJ25_15725 [Crocinitomicaceae bacterium]|nr:hypothetical protein [Crocinitomicaceae bacterium]
MTKPDKTKLQAASKKLRETLTFERIRQIPKYRNFKKEQYLQLIENIEDMAILLLESYIFIQNDTT